MHIYIYIHILYIDTCMHAYIYRAYMKGHSYRFIQTDGYTESLTKSLHVYSTFLLQHTMTLESHNEGESSKVTS